MLNPLKFDFFSSDEMEFKLVKLVIRLLIASPVDFEVVISTSRQFLTLLTPSSFLECLSFVRHYILWFSFSFSGHSLVYFLVFLL